VLPALWNNPQRSKAMADIAVKPPVMKKNAKFQYMRMEYCQGGDLEGLVRNHKRPLGIDTVRSMLFQMCFSLYACRDQIGLRHYDLKLLNFFVTHGRALLRDPSDISTTSGYVVMNVAFGEYDFALPLSLDEPNFVKLSDFGTSCVGSGSLGDPITMQQVNSMHYDFVVLTIFKRISLIPICASSSPLFCSTPLWKTLRQSIFFSDQRPVSRIAQILFLWVSVCYTFLLVKSRMKSS
jgi:serine/threonine protein kinase